MSTHLIVQPIASQQRALRRRALQLATTGAPARRAAVLSLVVVLAGLACGSGGAGPQKRLPPSGLTYSFNPAVYAKGRPITSNVPTSSGSAVESYTVSPVLPVGLSLNGTTGVISGTPTDVTPSAIYTVTARNTAGSTTAGVSIAVNDALLPPSGLKYAVSPATYTVGKPIAPNEPRSSGGAVETYEVTPSLPPGLFIDRVRGVILGTPLATSRPAIYTVTARNAAGSTTGGVGIEVNDALLPPSGLTYAVNPATYVVGTSIGSNAPTSSGGAAESYAVSPALPTGLSLNTATGVLSGTPTAAAAAARYTVTASNAAGSTTVGLSIAVNVALLPPSGLTYAVNPATYTAGTPIASNAPTSSGGAVESYAVSPALPTGLSLNTATGVLSGTPAVAAATASYTVTASNAAGSTTAGLSIAVNVALLPPSGLTYAVNPATYTAGTPIASNAPTSSGGAVESYAVSPALPTGLSLNTATGVLSGTPTAAAAAASYTVTASNAAGSTTVGLSIAVNVALLPPSGLTYAVNPATYVVGTPIGSNTPTSSGGAVASYAVFPSLPAGLSLNTATGVLSGTPTAAAATASYTVTASNTAGSTTVGLSIAVNVALLPPSGLTYAANPATYTAGTPIASNAPTSGGGAVESYAVSPALPTGLSLNTATGVLSGTPTAAAAAATYTVTASNAAGSTTAGLSIAVKNALLPPSGLTYAVNPAIYTVGTSIASNTPTSSGGAVASYAVFPSLPAGLSLNTATGILSGTPTAAAATASYTVTASNAAGSTTVGLSIAVKNALQPPSGLTYAVNPANYTADTPIAPNAPTSSGGAVESYAVSPALPTGLSLNTATGVLSGTPTVATAGASYTVTAKNSAGSATVALIVTVQPSVPDTAPPQLATLSFAPSSVDVTAQTQTITFTARITDDVAGFSRGSLWVVSPSATVGLSCYFTRVSGTSLDGVYACTVTVPRYVPPGTWNIGGIYLYDGALHLQTYTEFMLKNLSLPTTFQVVSTADTNAPELAAFSFALAVVAGAQTNLTITLRATDDLSGVAGLGGTLVAPDGSTQSIAPFTHTSGTDLDGVYTWEGQFSSSAVGTYHIRSVALGDAVGNAAYLPESKLQSLGFVTTFQIPVP